MTDSSFPPDQNTTDGAALERLFVESLPLIDGILGRLCARNGFQGDDADDVASWVKARLVESNYAVLAKFRGESSLAAYLAVVLAMQVREYRVAHWGRWRPSAAAREKGDVAVRLETLVHRDGIPVAQAVEQLRVSGATTLGAGELTRLAASLLARGPIRPHLVGTDALEEAPGTGGSDTDLDERADDEERRWTRTALDEAMGELPPEEQVMLRMRFWHGLSVAEVARGLAIPQKPLYRRLERALRSLRDRLELRGVSADRIRPLLGGSLPEEESASHVSDITPGREKPAVRPSTPVRDHAARRPSRGGPQ